MDMHDLSTSHPKCNSSGREKNYKHGKREMIWRQRGKPVDCAAVACFDSISTSTFCQTHYFLCDRSSFLETQKYVLSRVSSCRHHLSHSCRRLLLYVAFNRLLSSSFDFAAGYTMDALNWFQIACRSTHNTTQHLKWSFMLQYLLYIDSCCFVFGAAVANDRKFAAVFFPFI